MPNTWYTEPQGQLAKALSERTGLGGQCFFCNSGTEANEAAIKLARLQRQARPLQDHHACSTASTAARWARSSATGQPKYHQGLEPLLAGFSYAPFGDLDAAARLIDGETCAILVEPIQGEGGINLPPAGYLEGLRELADQHKLLLIFDEVQTGMGRTGRWFAHQHWDVAARRHDAGQGAGRRRRVRRPDRPAGGRREAAARHARRHVRRQSARLRAPPWPPSRPSRPTACCSAPSSIGERFRSASRRCAQRCPLIQDIRIKGAMIGVELTVDGAPVVKACLERRLLINCTHGTVLRLLPALHADRRRTATRAATFWKRCC